MYVYLLNSAIDLGYFLTHLIQSFAGSFNHDPSAVRREDLLGPVAIPVGWPAASGKIRFSGL